MAPGLAAANPRSGMTKVKIMQTPVRFSPYIGGVEKYVLELGKKFVALGNETSVVCADEPRADSGNVAGIKVTRLPYIAKVANTNITPGLFRTLMRADFDVIHTHIPSPWGPEISALVSLLKRKPLCVTYHNDIVGHGVNAVLAGLYNATCLHLVLWRAKTIVVTQPKYIERSSYLKRHHKKIAVIPVGVSEVAPSPNLVAHKPNHIFFMSILDKYHDYKGLEVLLRAVAKLKGEGIQVRLFVGGGGDSLGRYRQFSSSLDIDDVTDFLGVLTDQEVADAYYTSSIFVLPSLNKLEGFGIVALEALSVGTPVITTHMAGSAEFISSNRAGLIVRPGDVDELTVAIKMLLDDPNETRIMGERGIMAVRREFGWTSIAQRILEKY